MAVRPTMKTAEKPLLHNGIRVLSLVKSDEAAGWWNTRRPLTHSSDSSREGLAVNATRSQETAHDRFWAKVNKNGPIAHDPTLGRCWEWQAATKAGYGVFHPNKVITVGAHRYALAEHLGRPLVDGALVCHRCDNPPCVNPAHLYEGTSQQNVDDAVRRNRHKFGERGSAKLVEADVVNMRNRAANGETNRSLAAEFNISESMLSQIIRGQKWPYAAGTLSVKYKTTRKAA